MDFSLNDDQRMLKDTVDRLVARDYGFEQRKAYAKSPEGWSRAMWARMAEIGLLALPFPSAHGGLDGGPIESMLVMESLGRAMVLEPLLSSTVIGAAALKAASVEQLERWVPAIAGGELTLAWAHSELQSRYRLHSVACSARRVGACYVIEGVKPLVLHGDSADKLLVSARVHGRRSERDGIALFMVDADAPGVTRRGCRTHDGLRAAVITLAGVEVEAHDVIGVPGAALPVIERVAEAAIAALAAEAVGAMSAALDMTVEYLKTRQQFGGPIGRFQALQHRAAEMLIATEQARSMAMYAALMLGEADAVERRKALSAVKVQVGNSARFVGQQAIQLHGGIGVTEEYALGHYFKRLTMIESRFGDTDHHLAEFARAGGFIAPATAAA
jgi:pimeloyl-CoA dehydrogenase small subunit